MISIEEKGKKESEKKERKKSSLFWFSTSFIIFIIFFVSTHNKNTTKPQNSYAHTSNQTASSAHHISRRSNVWLKFGFALETIKMAPYMGTISKPENALKRAVGFTISSSFKNAIAPLLLLLKSTKTHHIFHLFFLRNRRNSLTLDNLCRRCKRCTMSSRLEDTERGRNLWRKSCLNT